MAGESPSVGRGGTAAARWTRTRRLGSLRRVAPSRRARWGYCGTCSVAVAAVLTMLSVYELLLRPNFGVADNRPALSEVPTRVADFSGTPAAVVANSTIAVLDVPTVPDVEGRGERGGTPVPSPRPGVPAAVAVAPLASLVSPAPKAPTTGVLSPAQGRPLPPQSARPSGAPKLQHPTQPVAPAANTMVVIKAPRSDSGPRTSSCHAQDRKLKFQGGRQGEDLTTAMHLQPISFIHIPSSGGTWIQDCTRDERQSSNRWGGRNPDLGRNFQLGKATCSGQHLPPSVSTFYSGWETFCVVRNPFDRAVSLFARNTRVCTAETLNSRIIEWLLETQGLTGSESKPYLLNCQLLPQAAFIEAWDSAKQAVASGRNRSCDYMLRYERFIEQFNALMEERGYPYRFGNSDDAKARLVEFPKGKCGASGTLSSSDLLPQTRDLLRKFYERDFQLLGLPSSEARLNSGDERRSRCKGQAKELLGSDGDGEAGVFQQISFVNIPRNGGQSIMDCTQDELNDGDRWGRRSNRLNQIGALSEKGDQRCWLADTPPSLPRFSGDPHPLRHLMDHKGQNGFCVVRNPYERLVSIFGARMCIYKTPYGACSAEALNRCLIRWLLDVKGAHNRFQPMPYFQDCTLLPQAAFVYGWDSKKKVVNHSARTCRHVLRYENLQEEFNSLMRSRGYPYRMGAESVSKKGPCAGKLSQADLWPETISLIHTVYDVDFKWLRLPMMSTQATNIVINIRGAGALSVNGRYTQVNGPLPDGNGGDHYYLQESRKHRIYPWPGHGETSDAWYISEVDSWSPKYVSDGLVDRVPLTAWRVYTGPQAKAGQVPPPVLTELLNAPEEPNDALAGRRVSMCKEQDKNPYGSEWRQKLVTAPLTLIHIPRTGGTSMEECTADEVFDSHTWGNRNMAFHLKHRMIKAITCWGQHVPPSMFPYYSGRDTFCCVRDPHERLISEFGFHEEFFEKNANCNAEYMNKRLVEWLTKAKHEPYSRDCHLLPQAAFVFGWDPHKQNVNRSSNSCNHVLRFERLAQDFNALMESRGYPYRFPEQRESKKKSMRSSAQCSALKRKDLSQRTKALLREVYRDDFELFNYSFAD